MSNRVAVVTGGRRGIGRGIAYALAQASHDVVLIDIVNDEATQETLEGLLQRGVRTQFVEANIGDVSKATAVCEKAFGIFGCVDTLVNNAGVQVQDRAADVLNTTVESFDRLMDINLRGTFFLTQAFANRMVASQDPKDFRSIITISSSNALHAKTTGAEYCLSKSALSMMNKIFALQLASHGIACYEIQPGLIKTDMNQALHDKYEPLVQQGLTPVRRWGTAEDVGHSVASLASGALRYMTGEILHVDGGMHIPKSLFENVFVKEKLA